MVARIVRTRSVSPSGEPGDRKRGRADQSGLRRVLEAANVERRHVVLPGEEVLGDLSHFEPSLIAEPEFIHHRWTQNFRITARDVDLPLVVDGAEARKGVGRIAVRILKTETAENRVIR